MQPILCFQASQDKSYCLNNIVLMVCAGVDPGMVESQRKLQFSQYKDDFLGG